MKFLAHHFTPLLDSETRWRIIRALGLSDLSFIFAECQGSEILSLTRICQERHERLIPPLRQKLEDWAGTCSLPVASLAVNDHKYRIDERSHRLSLTEDILPFPYSVFFRTGEGSPLRVLDEAFGHGLSLLGDGFRSLETLVTQNEFTVLWFKNADLKLLCRSVKGRRFHVGWSPEIAASLVNPDGDFGSMPGRVASLEVTTGHLPTHLLPLNRAYRALMDAKLKKGTEITEPSDLGPRQRPEPAPRPGR